MKVHFWAQFYLRHSIYTRIVSFSHCYFTRLNPKRESPFYFWLPALVGIHRNLNQKEFFRSNKRFLRVVLTGHRLPGPLWKIAKMALLNPCMELEIFWGPNVFFWWVPLSDFFPKVSQAPSKCFSKWINWIISRIPWWIWRIFFWIPMNSLQCLKAKLERALSFRVQSDEITVCFSFSYIVVHSLPSWLVWGRNQVWCACCTAQTAHKLPYGFLPWTLSFLEYFLHASEETVQVFIT